MKTYEEWENEQEFSPISPEALAAEDAWVACRAQMEQELALAVAQRDRFAEALKDCIVASGIPLDDCSLEPGPDLLALSMDLVRRFGEMQQ